MHRFHGTAAVLCVVLVTACGSTACSSGDDSTHDSAAGSTTTTARLSFSPCQLHKALSTMQEFPPPTNAREARDNVQFITDVYTAVADAAPPSRSEEAAHLRQGLVDLRKEGEAAGFSRSFLTQPPKALSTFEFSGSLDLFKGDYENACGTTTTVAGPPPG